jgi:hypothetical protein
MCDDPMCKVCGVKKEDGASITTSSTPENPSSHLNPEVGMKHPQYIQHKENDPMCKCEKCMSIKALFANFGKDYTKSYRIV